MKPSDFAKVFPSASVFLNNESETAAQNIMIMLARRGDTWRALTFDEYREIRMADGASSVCVEGEQYYFDKVVRYCVSEEIARLFSPNWDAL